MGNQTSPGGIYILMQPFIQLVPQDVLMHSMCRFCATMLRERNGGRLWNVLRAWIGAHSVKFAMMTRWTHFTHAFNPAVLLLTQKRSMKIIRPYFCMCTDIRGNWMLRMAISCGFCTSMSCHMSCLCFANFCQFPGSCLLIFHQARFELSWTYNKV